LKDSFMPSTPEPDPLKQILSLLEGQQKQITELTSEITGLKRQLDQLTRSQATPASAGALFPSGKPAKDVPAGGSQPPEAPAKPAAPVKASAKGAAAKEAAAPRPVGAATSAVIFCDGACSGNPGPGGWGCIVESDGERREYSGGLPRTTNNQMELQALIEGLKSLPAGTAATVVTDSEYLSKGITSWLRGWKRNGWVTAAGSAVKNLEQWQELDWLLEHRPTRTEWVKGHAGHEENERCDELARAAIKRQR
jgi:ribonuclease HI